MMPGRINGNVTFQNVTHALAPRSIAASSRWTGKPASLCPHRDDDVADVEHDVGDQDRHEVEREERRRADGHVERQERGAEDDLGRRHRQEDEQVGDRPAPEAVARQGQGDHRAERRRDGGREERDLEARDDRLLEAAHVEHVEPGVEREALPDDVALSGWVVEAEHRHDEDRQHQVRDGGEGVHDEQVAVEEPEDPVAERAARAGVDRERQRRLIRRHQP